MKNSSHEITEDKFLKESELDTLKDALRIKSRDALILRLLLETGARGSELLNISLNDLDLKNKTILIRGLKGSQDRRLPLKDHTALLLESYLKEKKPEHYLFNVCTRRLRQIWADFRPYTCKKGLHALRHTFAINLFKHKRDIRLVQFALGHRSIESTMVYSTYIYKTEELASIWKGVG